MIDVSKGLYWNKPWSLIDGCTPCSLGCEHCWAAAMAHRFDDGLTLRGDGPRKGKFNGVVITHPERLSIPLKRKKPTVYSIWNDWCHEEVRIEFRSMAVDIAVQCPQHTFLALTKRPNELVKFYNRCSDPSLFPGNWWNGLTVCNQQEWDEKGSIFLQVPGKKFLSHEPALERIDYGPRLKEIAVLISGAETGTGARPSHPDTFRSDRDQCAAAGMSFFFKQWGEWAPCSHGFRDEGKYKWGTHDGERFWELTTPWNSHDDDGRGEAVMIRVGRQTAGRLLDGRTHDDLLWNK